MDPLITIVVPVYNQERYIRECVDSVLSQTYKNIEIIVVDDGSTDGTPDILRSYGDKIVFIEQKHKGAAAALNNGIGVARGEYIGWLSSDDVFLDGKIASQIEGFRLNPNASLVHTDPMYIDSNGKPFQIVRTCDLTGSKAIRQIFIVNFINGSSVLIKKECFIKAGQFDESLIADVDGEMWFRLLSQGNEFLHIPEVLLKYRVHDKALSANVKLMMTAKDSVRIRYLEKFSGKDVFQDVLSDTGPSVDEFYEYFGLLQLRKFSFRSSEVIFKGLVERSPTSRRKLLKLACGFLSKESVYNRYATNKIVRRLLSIAAFALSSLLLRKYASYPPLYQELRLEKC